MPNVGKSTLFNAITKAGAEMANYPFATIDPNVGMVEVPDARLARIDEIIPAKKIVHTTFEFTDIAGIVKGASKGEGLGNKFWKTFVRLMRSCMSFVHLTTKISRTFLIRSIRWTISTRSTWNLFWPILNPSTNVMRALKGCPHSKRQGFDCGIQRFVKNQACFGRRQAGSQSRIRR